MTYCDIFDDDKYVAQFLNVNDIHFDISQEAEDEVVVEMMNEEPNN